MRTLKHFHLTIVLGTLVLTGCTQVSDTFSNTVDGIVKEEQKEVSKSIDDVTKRLGGGNAEQPIQYNFGEGL